MFTALDVLETKGAGDKYHDFINRFHIIRKIILNSFFIPVQNYVIELM